MKEHKVKLFKKVNKSVLSHITFYFEDDEYKPVDFHNETITFTCQLIKIEIFTLIQVCMLNIITHIRVHYKNSIRNRISVII